MKRRFAFAVLVLCMAAPGAEAGLFGRKAPKLPKAIDSPIVRPKVKESHKPLNHAHHPAKYGRPGWGTQWKQVYVSPPAHLTPYVKGY
jgi:hypothetical protein